VAGNILKFRNGGIMAISYRKLRELLIEKDIPRKRLKIMARVSNEVMSKIDKDEYMSMETLERLARSLNVQPGDLFELKG